MKKKLYRDEILRSMKFLSKNKKVIFLGQSVKYSGNSMYNTLIDIPDSKKLELPVFEEAQLGMSIGLALEGYIPVSCFPRYDFLILAMNQLVNHLDKIRRLSGGDFKPRVIIRTSVGAKRPIDSGIQHTQNFTPIFKKIFKEIDIVNITKPNQVFKSYKKALTRKDSKSTLLIEKSF
tara:strand:- start:8463 stop:8993 length:531 start_codon:yes stop_codon:yes gene_type:complete